MMPAFDNPFEENGIAAIDAEMQLGKLPPATPAT
jgi:hypothetical protein